MTIEMRLNLLACTATIAAIGNPVQAQAPTQSPAPPAADPGANDIVVTGTRIARPEFAAPNPIVSVRAVDIQDSGDTNVTNFLQRIPALVGSLDNTQTSGGNAVAARPFGAAGLNELNLRNLGVNRTLVLVDGRRHVAGEPNSAAVDINAIPTDLIERVDVLTGSASPIYGADGVSGVVNFILKRNFDGVAVRGQAGISSRGDAGNRFVSVTAGHNFADGRANIALAVEANGEDRVVNDDRDYLRQDQRRYLIPNDAAASDATLPHNILAGDLRYPNESPIGAIDINGDGIADFNGLGQPYRHGTPAAYYTKGPSDDTPVAGFFSGDLTPQIDRISTDLLARFDASDAFKLSLDAKYVRVRATTFDYFNSIYGYVVPVTNPTVPGTIRDAALAIGSPGVAVYRDNIDYGRHGESDLRQTYRAVIDASGRISPHATYDLSFDYGRTDLGITKINELLADRYYAAIDVVRSPATGSLACRSTLNPAAAVGATTFKPGPNSGCLPISLFGPGPVNPAALAFFQVNDASSARITQAVASASVSGDFGAYFRLPGGPVQFSFGGEYRRETSRFDPSANFVNGAFLLYNEPTGVTASAGRFDVRELFAELNAPILAHQRFAERLSLGAAYRYSRYSTIGETATWQVNGLYAPVRDVTFRASYGQSVRAPNIGELFQPTSGTSNFVVDPCTPQELGHGTQYRAANCAASLAAVGAVIGPDLQTGFNVAGRQTGNPNLRAETARTWTAGVVVRPRFLPGFTLSFDWYNLDLRGAVATPAPSDIPSLCVDQPTLANPFCAQLTRAKGTGGVIDYVVQPQNVASFRTAGADLDLAWLLRTKAAGTFDIHLVGGYLHRLDLIAAPGGAVTDNVDQLSVATQLGAPRFNFDFNPRWMQGPLTVGYNLRYFDKTRTQAKIVTDNDPLYAPPAQLRYSALWQHDVYLELRASPQFSFYGGVNNLTDQKPDAGNAINAPISAIGRFVYFGVKLNTDRRQ